MSKVEIKPLEKKKCDIGFKNCLCKKFWSREEILGAMKWYLKELKDNHHVSWTNPFKLAYKEEAKMLKQAFGRIK